MVSEALVPIPGCWSCICTLALHKRLDSLFDVAPLSQLRVDLEGKADSIKKLDLYESFF